MSNIFLPGNLVYARARTWVVQSGSSDEWLRLRPIGGADDEVTCLVPALETEPVRLAQFELPDPEKAGSISSAELLYNALRFQLRSGAGPFRSFGSIAVEPRSYQLVPLLMSMRQKVVRLLIADDVGIGKTIEAGLIVREMMDRGEINRFAVLCPPHLVDQWVTELSSHFNIEAKPLTAGTAARLEKSVPHGKTIVDQFPVLVVSLDYIKSEKHRDYFQTMDMDCIIVDEAHTCVQSTRAMQKRFELLKRLAQKKERHMILLTATPHSGNEEGFYSLLSLLNEDFVQLRQKTSPRDPLRLELAKCFVQRRRQDIAEWRVSGSDRMTGFPTRMTTELTYQLTNEWDGFFAHVQDYCQKMVDADGADNRLIWYAVLALFRCISSSPAAAEQALKNRLEAAAGDVSDDWVVNPDLQELDEGSDSDAEPALCLKENDELRRLLDEAKRLAGSSNDPKLNLLVRHVKTLLKDGFAPVIFCRFIATAQYVKKALQEALPKNVTVDCVTGELAPKDRKARVEAMGNAEKRVLVATDCLSEGINLQQYFTAVVHYDLAWNPTRHEQREGRVDRFGQKAKEIRCTMIYGENNPVDGFILKVILKKSEAIHKQLGIIVPVPNEKDSINKALIQAALFKDREKKKFIVQPELFAPEEFAELDAQWTNALEKAKRNRTVFAQQSIHPEEVYPLWQEQQEVLGGHSDLVAFSRNAVAMMGCKLEPLSEQDLTYRFPLTSLNDESIKQRFKDEGFENNDVIDLGEIHRSAPFINVLSEGVVDQALTGNGKLIARCAVAETSAVTSVTRVYLLRLRYQMRLAYRNQTRKNLLSEEIVPVAVTGVRTPEWKVGAEVRTIFSQKMGGNFSAQLAQSKIREAVAFIEGQTDKLAALAQERARQLLEEHTRVKEFTAEGSVCEVAPCLPVDVMAAFVLLPTDEE